MADVVATQTEVFASTDAQRVTWDVPGGDEVAKGTALVVGGVPGVAFAASGGHTKTESLAGLTITGLPDPGASTPAGKVSVATDGTHEFPVTGATNATTNGTPVYAVVASGKVTSLTLTEGTNAPFGIVNQPLSRKPSAAKTCVKIGA